jgi:hypothetical protein
MGHRLIDHWDYDGSLNATQSTTDSFNSVVFPTIKRVFAQTIATNIVPVQPMGGGNNGEELNRIRREIKEENRENKIESLIEDKAYVEKTITDHPDYIPSEGPSGQLFYLDFTYGTGSN